MSNTVGCSDSSVLESSDFVAQVLEQTIRGQLDLLAIGPKCAFYPDCYFRVVIWTHEHNLFVQESNRNMKIKIKSLLVGAVATSAVITGMAFQSSSAEALLLNGQTVSLNGDIDVARNGSDEFTLSFSGVEVASGGTSAPPFIVGDSVTVSTLSDLSLGTTAGPFNPFITGLTLTDMTDVSFNANTVNLRDSGFGTTFLNLTGEFLGASANDRLGFGNLSFQFTGFAPLLTTIAANASASTNFSSQLEVVPTPAAVLPALIGMGTAAFRKKKREGEEDLALAGAEKA